MPAARNLGAGPLGCLGYPSGPRLTTRCAWTAQAAGHDLPAVARQQTEPGWTPEESEAYLRRFHYRLGPEDLQGMERFAELLRAHGPLADD